jgi:hypothetical protein
MEADRERGKCYFMFDVCTDVCYFFCPFGLVGYSVRLVSERSWVQIPKWAGGVVWVNAKGCGVVWVNKNG